MAESGYASYLDPRLQPPEEQEETPQEVMERCDHCNACLRLCAMLHYGSDDPWDVMECVDCDYWEEI